MTLKLYGHLISQPTRAVAWLLRIKGLEHELVRTMPHKGETRTPAFLKMNPNGFIPVLTDGTLTLFEGNAIMLYLAEQHQWGDMYPVDLKTRAKVHQYLHWHHTNIRQTTWKILIPHILKAREVATDDQLQLVERRNEILDGYLCIMERFFTQPYIAESSNPTLADIAAYCEVDQLEALGVFDFAKYPRTKEWMQRMKELPYHEEVRGPLYDHLVKMKVIINTACNK